jgi:hypothetical protein
MEGVEYFLFMRVGKYFPDSSFKQVLILKEKESNKYYRCKPNTKTAQDTKERVDKIRYEIKVEIRSKVGLPY